MQNMFEADLEKEGETGDKKDKKESLGALRASREKEGEQVNF